MSKYDIRLDFKAEIIWIEPPRNRAEEFARDSLNLRMQRDIKEFEHHMSVYIREYWKTDPNNVAGTLGLGQFFEKST